MRKCNGFCLYLNGRLMTGGRQHSTWKQHYWQLKTLIHCWQMPINNLKQSSKKVKSHMHIDRLVYVTKWRLTLQWSGEIFPENFFPWTIGMRKFELSVIKFNCMLNQYVSSRFYNICIIWGAIVVEWCITGRAIINEPCMHKWEGNCGLAMRCIIGRVIIYEPGNV